MAREGEGEEVEGRRRGEGVGEGGKDGREREGRRGGGGAERRDAGNTRTQRARARKRARYGTHTIGGQSYQVWGSHLRELIRTKRACGLERGTGGTEGVGHRGKEEASKFSVPRELAGGLRRRLLT